jgi:hypothetical protein
MSLVVTEIVDGTQQTPAGIKFLWNNESRELFTYELEDLIEEARHIAFASNRNVYEILQRLIPEEIITNEPR